MTSISDLIGRLQNEWGTPRRAEHRGSVCPFLLHCTFYPSASLEPLPEKGVPLDLAEFWKHTRSARLFVDGQYGQWGLEVFDSVKSMAETAHNRSTRPQDCLSSDLIVGRFLGDSDLLVIRNDPSAADYGTVMVALPIDKRNHWYLAARSFSGFLERLIDAQGHKYWEDPA